MDNIFQKVIQPTSIELEGNNNDEVDGCSDESIKGFIFDGN